MAPPPPLFFILLLLFLYPPPSSSTTSPTSFIFKGCANQNLPSPQSLTSLFSTLLSQSSTVPFYKTTTTDQSTTITGLFQCRGDLSNAACQACVQTLPDSLTKLCGPAPLAARVHLAGCYIRYEAAGFPAAPPTQVLFKQCGSRRAAPEGFDGKLTAAMGELVKGINGNGKGFFAGGYEMVYVLGQCEGDLGGGECVNCVKSAVESVRSECRSAVSGQVYLQQCYVSYTYYPNGIPGSGGGAGIETGATETDGGGDDDGGRKINTQKTVAIVFGGLAGLCLGIALLLVLKSAFKKKKEKTYTYAGY